AWADPSGQAGIEFYEITPRTRRALRDWLLTQMLSAAALTGRDSIFAPLREDQLTFSPVPHAPIVLEPEVRILEDSLAPGIAWAWFQFSERSFSVLIDGLVLACAILLFSISAIVVMGGLPAWPLALAFLFTTGTIFLAVYQILFSDFLCGATP